MAGLFDGFEGYRVVSEAESREALTSALVAVDAIGAAAATAGIVWYANRRRSTVA